MSNTQTLSPDVYKLDKLLLRCKHTDLDLTYLQTEFNIYEDLFSSNITGEILLYESFNLLSNMPIVEGDLVDISVSINFNDETMIAVDDVGRLDMTFEIIKIKNRIVAKPNVQVYTLVLSTHGLSDNTFNRISKSWKGQSYSTIVRDIFNKSFQTGGLKSNLNKKRLHTENTDGVFDIVIPNWSPLRAINWCASRANVDSSANFIFYEDTEKFNFVSLNTLFKQIPVGTHNMSIANVKDSDKEKQYLSFTSMVYNNEPDITISGTTGIFGSRLVTYDIFTKQITDYTNNSSSSAKNYTIQPGIDYISEFNKQNHCENNPLIDNEINNIYSNNRRTVSTIAFNDDSDKNYIRQRYMQFPSTQVIKLTVTGPGNFSRKVGDMINFNVPSHDTSEVLLDNKLTGKYLITAIRRKFDKGSHIMVMELVKDSYYSTKPNHFWKTGISQDKYANLSRVGGL